jgi:hypothetical protein
MKTLEEMKQLIEQVILDAQKLEEKGTYSRGRSARKALSEISKLCKSARSEVLQMMKDKKEEK